MEDLRPLDPVEQRVLGALLEKERTVPASYPMTLNALRTACNQSSGRNPVMTLSDKDISEAIDRLKPVGVVRMVYASHGARSVKFRQVLDERISLDDGSRAVVTLLLLRGAQTPGELRTRSERLHDFTGVDQVDDVLRDLAEADPPLVEELPRQPGQKEPRWIHRLGPVEVSSVTAGEASNRGGASATEAVLREGPVRRTERVRDAYDRAATAYADRHTNRLDHLPFDRWLVERMASLAGSAPVADVGSGTGVIAFHLAAAGAAVTGFDLSPEMVKTAAAQFPEIEFVEADFTQLPSLTTGEGWGVITAWYSLVHLAASELPPALAILSSALRPGGWLAMAVQLGDEVRHVTDLFGVEVDVDFALHRRDAVLVAFDAAGLSHVEWYERGPMAGWKPGQIGFT